jgi:drug/metabolite transporter (DMT)-like permease
MPVLNEQQRAYIGLILITIIIGLSFIFVKIGLKYAGAMDLLAHRFTAGAISVGLLWLFGFIKISALNWTKAKSLFLLSLFYPLLFFALQTFGMKYSTASEAGIIFATVPIITLIVASIFLKEKTTILQKLGILISIVGIAYIMYNTGNLPKSISIKGVLLLFLSVFSVVSYYVLGQKISVEFSVLEITVWMTILAFIVFNGFSIVNHVQSNSMNEFFEPLAKKEFLWTVLYLGILSFVVTSFLTNFALSKISVSQIAVFNNLSPIIAILGGILILDETLHNYQIIGGVLVITGVVMTQVFNNKYGNQKMIKQNIQNLTSLWETAGKEFDKFSKDNNICIANISNSDWPNRIWTDQKISKKIIGEIKLKMHKENGLVFSYFNEDTKKSPSNNNFTLKSVQYGMSLPLNTKFEIQNSVNLQKVTNKQSSALWSSAFYNAFKYKISTETVIKTKNEIQYFLIYHKDELVGTAVLFNTDKVAGIHSLGILPSKRKLGFANETMCQILNIAIDQNLSLATLQASEMAKKMYVEMGFSNDFIIENYQL